MPVQVHLGVDVVLDGLNAQLFEQQRLHSRLRSSSEGTSARGVPRQRASASASSPPARTQSRARAAFPGLVTESFETQQIKLVPADPAQVALGAWVTIRSAAVGPSARRSRTA